MRTFAYGTDASFYRLNPKMVVKVRWGGVDAVMLTKPLQALLHCCRDVKLPLGPSLTVQRTRLMPMLPPHLTVPMPSAPPFQVHNEEEIRRILPLAQKHQVPVTFRAAGTSLSAQVRGHVAACCCNSLLLQGRQGWGGCAQKWGRLRRHVWLSRPCLRPCSALPSSRQALTDSVLLKISHTGRNFRNYTVHGDGSSITVEPGLIGGEVGLPQLGCTCAGCSCSALRWGLGFFGVVQSCGLRRSSWRRTALNVSVLLLPLVTVCSPRSFHPPLMPPPR